jgi:hypothetical protein
MSGVVSHGPANLYDSSGHQLISVELSTGGTSSYALGVTLLTTGGGSFISSATIVITPEVSDTGTATSITASSSVQTILSSNASRLGATIYNQSGETLYILLASTSTPASTSNCTVGMVGLSYYELPYSYVGAITGLWSPSSGFARVTELS